MAEIKAHARYARSLRTSQVKELDDIEENLKALVESNLSDIEKAKFEVEKHIDELRKNLLTRVEQHRKQVITVHHQNIQKIRQIEEELKESKVGYNEFLEKIETFLKDASLQYLIISEVNYEDEYYRLLQNDIPDRQAHASFSRLFFSIKPHCVSRIKLGDVHLKILPFKFKLSLDATRLITFKLPKLFRVTRK